MRQQLASLLLFIISEDTNAAFACRDLSCDIALVAEQNAHLITVDFKNIATFHWEIILFCRPKQPISRTPKSEDWKLNPGNHLILISSAPGRRLAHSGAMGAPG